MKSPTKRIPIAERKRLMMDAILKIAEVKLKQTAGLLGDVDIETLDLHPFVLEILGTGPIKANPFYPVRCCVPECKCDKQE
jgi:hypothetical protein